MSDETKIKRSKQRIWVTDSITRQLCSEFNVRTNTVLIALKFYYNSGTSKKIRARAIELMEEVMIQNEQLIQEYDQD